jgi:hypothetical protein
VSLLFALLRFGLSVFIVGCCLAFLGAFLITLGAWIALNQPINPDLGQPAPVLVPTERGVKV